MWRAGSALRTFRHRVADRWSLGVADMLVHEVMTTPVVTVPKDWTVKQAVHLLYESDVTAAPVLDEDVVGRDGGHPGHGARRDRRVERGRR